MTNDELRIATAKARGWTAVLEDTDGVLFGIFKKHASIVPNYPDSMDACMELIEEVKNTGFSSRQRFVRCLRMEISSLCQFDLNPAEWIFVIEPREICDAYLAWKEGE